MYRLSEQEIIKEYIDLLYEFDKFCKKNDIKYCLAYGALLGAVRHKGFIPWDNDIDIFLFRKDAEKLKQCSDKIDNSKYAVGIREYYCKNVHSRVYFYDTTTQGECSLNNVGIHMDGFILNDIPNNLIERFKFFYYDKLLILKYVDTTQITNPIKKSIVALAKIIYRSITSEEIGDKYLKTLNRDWNNNKFISIMRTPYGIKKYPKKIFTDTVQLEYEGNMYPCPAGYKEFLKITYGDYMTPPPPEKRIKKLDVIWKKETIE